MNNNIIIKDCWYIIRQKKLDLLNGVHNPLSNIETYLSYFNLPIFSQVDYKFNMISIDLDSTEPSFKILSDEILVSLRHHIYTPSKSALVKNWSEYLLRFSEVRYRSLKNRAIGKCHTKEAAQLHLLHLAAFFMDQAIYTKDIRLLNIVLKTYGLQMVT